MAPLEESHLVVDEGEDQEQGLASAEERRMRRAFLAKALKRLPRTERKIIFTRHLRQQATPLKDWARG